MFCVIEVGASPKKQLPNFNLHVKVIPNEMGKWHVSIAHWIYIYICYFLFMRCEHEPLGKVKAFFFLCASG